MNNEREKEETTQHPVSTVVTALSMGVIAAAFGAFVYAFMPNSPNSIGTSNAATVTIDSQHRCPKCHGLMEEGFPIDNTGECGYPEHAKWGTGTPVRKYWGANQEIANAKAITSYRCINCGYVEEYAK